MGERGSKQDSREEEYNMTLSTPLHLLRPPQPALHVLFTLFFGPLLYLSHRLILGTYGEQEGRGRRGNFTIYSWTVITIFWCSVSS